MEKSENVYLGQVLQQQAKVDQELRRRAPAPVPRSGSRLPGAPTSSEAAGRAVDYRITGFWRFRTVVVPPNAYVVHTRRGHERPLDIGLGVSFRFDPYTDSFLVIPAAMQTIVINANCICKERQGILVQAYVQWIINDIETAYRKLDFSDAEDPMRIVNVQLREQAEAAIKDKVATMSIDDVLSDKQPIIEELTHRLRGVAEGSREAGSATGLGLQIVTVQIKEAVVSSTRLWEHLQAPFRAGRGQLARMAELAAERAVDERELGNGKEHETSTIEAESEVAAHRAAKERERYDREQAEKERRHLAEMDALERSIARELETAALQKSRATMDAELERERLVQRIQSDELAREADHRQAERELQVLKARRAIENEVSPGLLREKLVAMLPDLAQKLPPPAEMHAISVAEGEKGGPLAQLLALIAGAVSLVRSDAGPDAPAASS